MADFIGLLKANEDCFSNPRFIIGNPWNNEPYGYCCSNGRRAFVSLNNCTWHDRKLVLQLGPDWGLPTGISWDIYRWHPEPAKLQDPGTGFTGNVEIALRPFQVLLLEMVPHGSGPSLGKEFRAEIPRSSFVEPSRDLCPEVMVAKNADGFPAPIREEEPD